MPRGKPKGLPRSGGRKKGTLNKSTVELKTMILSALEGVGGQGYLQSQALATPASFMALLGRILPTTLAGDKENPLEVALRGIKPELANKLDSIAQRRGN